MSKQEVVIIGGGLSAKHAAEVILKKAKKEAQVTIIQANAFAEWPLAMTVCLVKPELHYKALATDMNKFQVPGVIYKYGVAESVDTAAKQVNVSGGVAVPYDALVIATGFVMPLVYPGLGVTVEQRMQEVKSVGAAISNGSCIVVAGGGLVALELAGNIRAEHPSKRIVLLTRNGVLNQWPESKRRSLLMMLERMKIEMRIMKSGAYEGVPETYNPEGGTIKCGAESEVKYDVFIPAYSQGPNTKFLPADLQDDKGNVQVNEHLQSTVQKEVFAVGVSDVKEPFIGMPKLEAQWLSVAANVTATLQGKPLKKHKEGLPWMKSPPLVVIGHGPKGYAFWDCDNVPPPCKCCCCCGLGGFPCCPPCWPCLGCAGLGCCPCGYCCCSPNGSGGAKFAGKMAFMSSGFHFKGMGDTPTPQSVAPAQQTM